MGNKIIPTFNKIIVQCDQSQKNYMKIGDIEIKMAHGYEKNYREKAPVIATVIEGNSYIHEKDVLICHHNIFFQPSAYYLYDDLFSIPCSSVIFAKLLTDNSILPICGNILVERIKKETVLPLPPELQKNYDTKYKVIDAGYTNYKNDTVIHTRPFSAYDIVYYINNEKKIATKVDSSMICGIVK